MKLIVALLGAAAMISLSGPASAEPPPEPDGDDAGFVAALSQAGITFASQESAVAAGRAVCSFLNNGETGLQVVHDVTVHNPGMDMDTAPNFALISAKYHCPHQLSKA